MKNIIKSALIASVLGLSFNTLAADQSTIKSGVVHGVDFKAYTLTIVNDSNGQIEEFSFSPSTRTTADGQNLRARSVLKPGQKVDLKLRANPNKQASL